MIADLTNDDFDALYVVVHEHMPRITREIFASILDQLVAQGVLRIDVTDTEIAVRLPAVPKTGVYRVERKASMH
jgi:hypothetical protein